VDLHNLMHFLSLRADAHAQYEIRAYAEAILGILQRWVPLTCESFLQHRLHAVTFSAAALAVVKRLLAGEAPTQEDSGLSKREWRELMVALGREA
jgi:thymidylate synthase (FAD)